MSDAEVLPYLLRRGSLAMLANERRSKPAGQLVAFAQVTAAPGPFPSAAGEAMTDDQRRVRAGAIGREGDELRQRRQ